MRKKKHKHIVVPELLCFMTYKVKKAIEQDNPGDNNVPLNVAFMCKTCFCLLVMRNLKSEHKLT